VALEAGTILQWRRTDKIGAIASGSNEVTLQRIWLLETSWIVVKRKAVLEEGLHRRTATAIRSK
jgi:hypothetical protein